MSKPLIDQCNHLLNSGFSIIPVGEKKRPNGAWKQQQTTPYTVQEFEPKYHDPKTLEVGICTGYNDLEVVDVDLKVFGTTKEKVEFWKEFVELLRNHIYDFDDKFVIVKTQNAGFHILYRTKLVQGNLKLAKTKGHKEALIETRGIGGYVMYYDNFLNNKYYTDVQYITDDEREILMNIIDFFDYKEDVKSEPIQTEKVSIVGVTSWDDYNSKNNVWEVIKDEFTEIYRTKDKVAIKRHGAKSFYSGYIYKDHDILYLFSTGTHYPAEKGLSAFSCYAYKHHHGDYSAAAKKLYADGYGDRIVRKEIEVEEPKKDIKAEFPIDIFPPKLQHYILECKEKLGSSIDFMGCAMLWTASMIIGNSMQIRSKIGWEQSPVLWFALVGKTGVGKSPSVGNIIRPLEQENGFEVKKYFKDYEKWAEWNKLSDVEKKKVEPVEKPEKRQFIVGDTTIEALVQLHQQNQNGVGIHKDELAGWVKDMNKYRDGSDKETFLSIWDGKTIIVNRVMTESNAYLGQPFIPIIGGIQPTIFSSYYTAENKDSGFLDRILICYPDLEPEYYNGGSIDYDLLQWYDDSIRKLYRDVRTKMVEYNEDGGIEPRIIEFSKPAKKEFVRIYNKIVDKMRSDSENEYLKSMLPKQQKYIPRFALCLHLFDLVFGDVDEDELQLSTLLNAEKLSDYFILNAEKVKVGANESRDIERILKNQNASKVDRIRELYELDPDFDRTKAAEFLECSRAYVYNVINAIKGEKG